MSTPPGESFSYDGTHVDNLMIVAGPNSFLPGSSQAVQSFGAIDGGAPSAAVFEERRWSDTCHLTGTDYENTKLLLDDLKFALDPRNGEKVVLYDQELRKPVLEQRQFLAKLAGSPKEIGWLGIETAVIRLDWVASNPMGQSLAATVETPTVNETPETFFIPVSAAEVVPGTNAVRPTYLIENTSGGAVATIVLANVTTSQSLTWTGNLGIGAFLRINDQQHIEKSSNGNFAGEESNAMSGLQPGDPFPVLAATVRNQLTLTGFSAANLTVTFTGEFM